MGKWYWVHAVSDCEYCVEAVKLLNQTGFQYVLSLYDRNPAVLESVKTLWNHNTTPIIVEYSVAGTTSLIGGCDDLHEYFKELGYSPEENKQLSDDQPKSDGVE